MQKPEEVIAFLLDKGNAEFVKQTGYPSPWESLVQAVAQAEQHERVQALDAALEQMNGEADALRGLIYAAMERRLAKKREATPLEETPPALLDAKSPLPLEDLIVGLREEEDGDAGVLAKLYQHQIAYDHSQPQNGWHLWNGQYWEQDTTNQVINILRSQVAAQYVYTAADLTKAGKDDLAKPYLKRAERLHTRRRKEHVLWAAASLPGIALSGDEWDSNPWLLGVANGVLDLQTGTFRPGKPTDWIKTIAPTEWQGLETPAPRWEQFIREIFDNDVPTMAFVQRLLGYGITGLHDEHTFPVLWGTGRNGKSTLLETIKEVLGSEIAFSIPAPELMQKTDRANVARPFIAQLRGKRIVWAAETTQDRRLDAETVKHLTGGDSITARAMYSSPVTFTPGYLLLLLTNYRPKIEAADIAIWDRVHLIPFQMRFVPNPQKDNERPADLQLQRKLKAEAPGILAWLVRGCLDWQARGKLDPPAAVLAHTHEYRDEEDTVSQFIDDYCVQSPDARCGHRELYKEYVKWCKDLRLWASGSRDFGVMMRNRFESKRMTQGIYYIGIGLPLGGPSQQMSFSENENA
jgi:putative DNA primase/helicase